MKFIVPTLLFSGLAVAAAVDVESPLAPRSTKTIIAGIRTISADIKTLNSSVTAFTGDFAQAITITTQSMQLSDDIQAATNTTNASPKLNNAGSAKVGTAILKLEPNIFSLLDNIVSKKEEFNSIGFGVGGLIVLQQLQDQKGYTDDFGLAIQSKLTKAYAKLAPKIRKKIDKAFDKAIAAYQPSFPPA